MFSSWMVADHDDPSPRLPASKGTEILSKDLSELSLSENYGKTPVHWLTIYHHVHSVSYYLMIWMAISECFFANL